MSTETMRAPHAPCLDTYDFKPLTSLSSLFEVIELPELPSTPPQVHEATPVPRELGAHCVNMTLRALAVRKMHPSHTNTPEANARLNHAKSKMIELGITDKAVIFSALAQTPSEERDDFIADLLIKTSVELRKHQEKLHLAKIFNGVSCELMVYEELLAAFGQESVKTSSVAQDRIFGTDFFVSTPDGLTIRVDAKAYSPFMREIGLGKIEPLTQSTGYKHKQLHIAPAFGPVNVPILYVCPSVWAEQNPEYGMATVKLTGKAITYLSFSCIDKPSLTSELVHSFSAVSGVYSAH